MLGLSDNLRAILLSKFQAGADGFRGRVEVDTFETVVGVDADWVVPAVDLWGNITGNPAYTWFDADDVTVSSALAGQVAGYWATPDRQFVDHIRVKWNGSAESQEFFIECCELEDIATAYLPAALGGAALSTVNPGGTWRTVIHASGGQGGGDPNYVDADGVTRHEDWDAGYPQGEYTFDLGSGVTGRLWRLRVPAGKGNSDIGTVFASGTAPAEVVVHTHVYPVTRIAPNKSLTTDADACEVDIDNADGLIALDTFLPNMPCRAFAWYGDGANAVQVFDMLIDRATPSRHPNVITISGRDWMKKLLVQKLLVASPQSADDDAAVRDPSNYVYLGWELSAIVADLLDKAFYPADKRSITATGITADEFLGSNDESFASALSRLADLAGAAAIGWLSWVDESHVYHFEPNDKSDPRDPDYTFTVGVDLLRLASETDDDQAYTRVRVTGPMSVTAIADAWDEVWESDVLAQPVGIWYDPTDSGNIKVLTRDTKRIYVVRLSDRVILDSWYVGDNVGYPLGLSGDPGDSTRYLVLSAPWYTTGGAAYGIRTGNVVHEYRKADNVHLASYALPDGRWSALKASAAYIWLTDYDTDQVWQFDRATITPNAGYTLVDPDGGLDLANPTGLAIDRTTVYVFYLAGKSYVVDESAPTTITRTVTSSVGMGGGEINTDNHTSLYVDSDSLSRLWEYTVATITETSYEVAAEAINATFEAQIEALSGTAEIRRLTVRMEAILSLADAQAMADLLLAKASHFGRTLDVGIIGNPGIQKVDKIRVIDPVLGISSDWQAGTYRSELAGDAGTYLGALSMKPWDPLY